MVKPQSDLFFLTNSLGQLPLVCDWFADTFLRIIVCPLLFSILFFYWQNSECICAVATRWNSRTRTPQFAFMRQLQPIDSL